MTVGKLLAERHEDDLASWLPSATRTAGSGAKRESHDIRTLVSRTNEWWQVRYEAKCTQKKSYSIKLDEWNRLSDDTYSSSAQERPALAVRFYGDSGTPVIRDLVVVDLHDWCELLGELEQLRGGEAEVPKA